MDDAELTKRILAYLGRLPGWEWRPNGPAYAAADVGLFYGQIRPDPDRAIGARVYAPADGEHLSVRRLQLRLRGARGRPDGADTLADIAFAAMSGIARLDGILSAQRISFSPLGADVNGREERTENYIITLDNLEAS